MATHDYVISNGTGAAVRADLNNALAAIVSNNSNSSEPTTKYAYQWWADLSNAVMKIRNSANDGWIELFQLDGTITLEDGSASTPALAFRDDLNTGIFSSAADTFNVATGGVERMELGATTIFNEDGADVDFRIEGTTPNLFYLDAGNNRIGLGDAAPAAALDVRLDVNPVIAVDTGSASNANLNMQYDGTLIGQLTAANGDFQVSGAGASTPISFYTNGEEHFKIEAGGNVRITDEHLRFDTTGKGIIFGNFGGSNRPGIFGNYTSATNNNIVFNTTGSERMRVDSSGRLLIGLTSALDTTAASLNITGLTSGARIATQGTTTSANSNLTEFFAHWTTNKVAGFIMKSGTDTTNKDDGSMHFSTNDGSGLSEALTILNNQKVGVNNTSPSEVLHVTGNILASGTITPSSDIAFKKDVEPLQNALSKITQLLGINFTYKDNNEKSMGLVAQDVEKVYPELIRGEEGSKSLNYMGLTGAIVEAIKELSDKVSALEKL